MISIIICSANQSLLKQVRSNVEETAGIPVEILAYDNSKGEKGICEVYNQGARDAKYPLLCYMHEDIQINTVNWGQFIADLFHTYPNLGLLGVAGTTYKSWMPSSWGHAGLNEIKLHRMNLIQHFQAPEKPLQHLYENPKNEKLSYVACIDGVWFCTRKTLVETFPFNEKILKGFHGYDMDFSLSLAGKADIAVTYEILIEHFSEGKFDEKWMVDTYKLHDFHTKSLPVNIAGLSEVQSQEVERRVFLEWIKRHETTSFPKHRLLSLLNIARARKAITKVTYWKLRISLLRSLFT